MSDGSRQARIERFNGSFSVSPGVVIAVNISNVKVADQVFPTGEHNISIQTVNGATIAAGLLPDAYIGRPSQPLNILLENCKANWPSPDPRCVQVSWNAPVDDAGFPIVKYKVTFAASSIRFKDIVQAVEVDAQPGGNLLSDGSPLLVKSMRLAEGFIYLSLIHI